VLAVLYDIHGNLPALDAVLEDARAAGARRYLLGGDYALFGPNPAETVERLRSLEPVRWIRGNGERWTASPSDAPDDETVQGAIRACREALGQAVVDELATLPESQTEADTRFVHGSPPSDVRSFLPEPADDEGELLAGVAEGRLVFGHTHLQFRRRAPGGIELVNPGSVGMPFDGDPRAGWALLSEDGDIELRRVPYDHEASAAAVRERFPGFGETVARRIERSAFVS
jgi:diadenosine tetraphosphatase ApaH/serine/threonine PP2A family protein phosphatase